VGCTWPPLAELVSPTCAGSSPPSQLARDAIGTSSTTPTGHTDSAANPARDGLLPWFRARWAESQPTYSVMSRAAAPQAQGRLAVTGQLPRRPCSRQVHERRRPVPASVCASPRPLHGDGGLLRNAALTELCSPVLLQLLEPRPPGLRLDPVFPLRLPAFQCYRSRYR
jgi:hypothetical protein